MDVKEHLDLGVSGNFEIAKICRICLTESPQMQSLFLTSENNRFGTYRTVDLIMSFTTLQIRAGDGLPEIICLSCAEQTCSMYSFKQLCEQSDTNLRIYLGKPAEKTETITVQHDEAFTNKLILEALDLQNESSTDASESEFDKPNVENIELIQVGDKVIAQRQLIKSAKQQAKIKSQKHKKKVTPKVGAVVVKQKRKLSQCDVCQKKFVNLKAFRKHLKTHIEDRPFKCDVCPRTFTEGNYLNNHMRTHMPDEQKPHQCTVCDKRFIHANLLDKHMQKHNEEKPYVCGVCGKGCYAENSLVKHMKIHEKRQESITVEGEEPAPPKHICDYCRTEFDDAGTLNVHIKQHKGNRPFQCTTCGKAFPQRFNLDLHLRTHTGERPFTCEVCQNGYVSKASLKIHMRTHTNERPFVCDFCGRAFRQSGDLTSHKRLHGTDTPIECTICRKRFTTLMKLKYHMRNHTGERPYVCNICGRGFTVNTILARHMRVHSGERPYVCVICGKAFSQSSTLSTHMKVHDAQRNNVANAVVTKFDASQQQQQQQQQPQQQQQQQQPMQPLQSQDIDIKYHSVDTKFIIHDPNQRLIGTDPSRAGIMQVQPDNSATHPHSRPHPSSIIITDNVQGILNMNDTRLLNEGTRLLVNVSDPPRLIHPPPDQHHISNVAVNRQQHNMTAAGDKYMSNYDPYHHRQGQL